MRILKNLLHWRWMISMILSLGLAAAGLFLIGTPKSADTFNRKIASSEIQSWLDENSPYDLVNFTGVQLALRAKIRLAQKAQLQKIEDEGLQLVLPSFLMRQSSGLKVSVCEVLPHLEVVIQAEDVAINGEPVQVSMRSRCQVSHENVEVLEPVIFSRDQLEANPMADRPKTWFVKSVQLYSDQNKYDLIQINSVEIREVLGRDVRSEL